MPPEIEWFTNIDNPRTRAAYQQDLREFIRFVGIERPEEFRTVTRSHVLAWRKDLEARAFSPATIRRKLSALHSLFNHIVHPHRGHSQGEYALTTWCAGFSPGHHDASPTQIVKPALEHSPHPLRYPD